MTNKLESEWNSSASEYIKRVQEMNKKMDQSRNDSYLYKPEDGEFLEPMVCIRIRLDEMCKIKQTFCQRNFISSFKGEGRRCR